MRKGPTAEISQLRDVVDVGQLGAFQADFTPQASSKNRIAQRLLERKIVAQIERQRQRGDQFAEPQGGLRRSGELLFDDPILEDTARARPVAPNCP
jgi:hypothetical protein